MASLLGMRGKRMGHRVSSDAQMDAQGERTVTRKAMTGPGIEPGACGLKDQPRCGPKTPEASAFTRKHTPVASDSDGIAPVPTHRLSHRGTA